MSGRKMQPAAAAHILHPMVCCLPPDVQVLSADILQKTCVSTLLHALVYTNTAGTLCTYRTLGEENPYNE